MRNVKQICLATLALVLLSVPLGSTYADTSSCHVTTTAITGSLVEKGVSVFGKSPEVVLYRGSAVPVFLSLLHVGEFTDADTISVFREEGATSGYVLVSQAECALGIITVPSKTLDKVVDMFDTARQVNAR